MGKFRVIAAILIILFLFSTTAYGEENKKIEIFDINKEQVVKTIEPNEAVQQIVLDYLHQIDGYVAKCDPIPNEGYAVRVPFKSSINMHNQWINGSVYEVIIIIPDKKHPPFLVVFEDGERFLCLGFNGSVDKLSKTIDFQFKDIH